jgi:hypothetical protein
MLHKYLSETYTKHRFHMMLDDGKKKESRVWVTRSDSENNVAAEVVVVQSSG